MTHAKELNQRAERRCELRESLNAFTALPMAPRPDWVEAIAGPLRA